MTTTIERLVVPIEWKASDDDQILEGYASTFGNVDLGGDVVVKGAFAKTIQNIKANGIPLLADHTPSVHSVLGTIFDAKEDGHGLKIRARFSSAQSAQDARTKLIEGHVNKMSIGYEPMDWSYEEREGRTLRMLKEIKLWETSVVVFPMNPEAVISRVKSIVGSLEPEQLETVGTELAAIDYAALVEQAKAHRTDGVVDKKTGTVQSTQISTADEAGGSGDDLEEKAAADQAATSTDEDEDKATDEAVQVKKGYDRWSSEAVLNGNDPSESADEVTRARLNQLLDLEESASVYTTLDPASRAELDRQLRATDDEVSRARRRFSHPS